MKTKIIGNWASKILSQSEFKFEKFQSVFVIRKLGLDDESKDVLSVKKCDFEFWHVPSDPNFPQIVTFDFIDKRLAQKWINFDNRRVLEAANCEKLRRFFAFQNYKVGNHFRYVDNVNFFDLELSCDFYLRQSINVTRHSYKVRRHLRKSNQRNVSCRQSPAKLQNQIVLFGFNNLILAYSGTFQQHVNVTVLQYDIFNRRYVRRLVHCFQVTKLMYANIAIARTRYQVPVSILNQFRYLFCMRYIHSISFPTVHLVTHYFRHLVTKSQHQIICPRSENHRTTNLRHRFCIKSFYTYFSSQVPKLYASWATHQHCQTLIHHFQALYTFLLLKLKVPAMARFRINFQSWNSVDLFEVLSDFVRPIHGCVV